MSGGFQSAEKMFWKSPELVDKLISFLDVESVSRLAELHQLTAQVLQHQHLGQACQEELPLL